MCEGEEYHRGAAEGGHAGAGVRSRALRLRPRCFQSLVCALTTLPATRITDSFLCALFPLPGFRSAAQAVLPSDSSNAQSIPLCRAAFSPEEYDQMEDDTRMKGVALVNQTQSERIREAQPLAPGVRSSFVSPPSRFQQARGSSVTFVTKARMQPYQTDALSAARTAGR